MTTTKFLVIELDENDRPGECFLAGYASFEWDPPPRVLEFGSIRSGSSNYVKPELTTIKLKNVLRLGQISRRDEERAEDALFAVWKMGR